MDKLKFAIFYGISTTLKPICVFYFTQYFIVLLITLIIGISMGTFDGVGTNGLEINTVIFVGIVGVLGFHEDFKMLLQNGFTRKYIFWANVSLFIFLAGIMAMIDTVVGQVLHYFTDYQSLFGSIYGYENIFANWIWLAFFYMMILSLGYLGVLIINKAGKNGSIYLGICFGGIVLLIAALFRYVFSAELVNNILEFLTRAVGFMADGTINYMYPLSSILILFTVLLTGSHAVICKTELK